jgi:hypothetical protein
VSYIDKNSDVVISARLTDEGRKLLSIGLLTFNTFKLGDSEIDYSSLGPTYDISLENIIRAKSCQPDVKTPILPTPTTPVSSAAVGIPTLTPFEILTVREAPELGFYIGCSCSTGFSGTYTVNTFSDHVLQSDTEIPLSLLSGGTMVPVRQSSTYSVTGNTYEPKVGDLMFVKMSNDELVGSGQTNGIIEEDLPVPYLWFKVQATSGTLSADTLTVTLDRDFAYFPGYVGSNTAWTVFYPSGDQFTIGGFYSGGTVWNQNNVWTNSIAGVDASVYETFESYGSESFVGSKEFFGYTSEITDPCELVRSTAILHYSNFQTCTNQSEITYGQKLYIDTAIPDSPVLKMPTLMWHRTPFSGGSGTGNIIGHTFSGTGIEQFVTLSGQSTTVSYYDLVDENANVVGRLFPNQQIFAIDDQELVAAMSYKSNRNWTLPTMEYGLKSSNDGLIGQTQDLYVTYLLASNTGYTTGLHNQNYTCVKVTDEECPDNAKKDVEVFLPLDQLPYMTTSGGTGFYADRFYIIAQRVTSGSLPTATGWRIMDYTSSIGSHTVGNRIDPKNLENSTYLITKSSYNSGTTYNLHDFINIPTLLEPEILQFGDEAFFHGNVCADGLTRKYRTKFNLVVPPNQFNTTTNLTWPNSGQNVHISEVGIYSNTGELVAVGKLNVPIEKSNNTTITIEIAFDL